MKSIYIFAIIISSILWLSAISISYGQTILCYDRTILVIFQLNYIIPCLEDRIVILENAPSGSGNATILNDLGDVITTSPSDNQFLRHDGTKWINESVSGGLGNATILDDLGDVDIVNAQPNDFLKYNGTQWTDATINEDNTVCANVGTGSQVYKDSECNFRTILGSSDISVTQQTNTVTVDYNGTLVSDKQVAQVLCYVDQDVTKTNLATTYTDVYTAAFDNELHCGDGANTIQFTNATYVKISFQVDFVGAGTNQYRWVDVDNNNNVLIESATIGVDCDVCNTNYFLKPAWLTGDHKIEWQAKSSNGTNDPIMKGYVILVK